MKHIILLSLIIITFSCKKKEVTKGKSINTAIILLTADDETTPVISNDDAADDPSIWVNAKDTLQSRIIGTDKKHGFVVYNLDGEIVKEYPVGRVNNVDVRSRIQLGDSIISIVGASNRTTNTLEILAVDESTGDLQEVLKNELKSQLEEVYGFCLYHDSQKKELFAFVVGKDGGLEQWELYWNEDKLSGKIVRGFQVGSISEGMVADDFYGDLYVAEENVALWKYKANKNADTLRTKLISTTSTNMSADFEGVALYESNQSEGYLLLSSQGNNSYAIFDRKTNNYLKSFSLVDSKEIDGTNDTDGIDVCSVRLGEKYPEGIFIAQDGANTKGKDTLSQNFKIVDWKKIKNVLQ
jgi:3-phytase